MKKLYDGLDVFKVTLNDADIITSSTKKCDAMIQLRMEGGICVSPEYQQQVEYVGDQG